VEFVGEQCGEDPIHPDEVVDQLAHRPVRAGGRRRPLFGPDLGDQLSNRCERAAELLDRGCTLAVAAFDAELVALRVGEHHPPSAVGAAQVIDHPGAEAKDPVDLLVASSLERHQVEVHSILHVL